MRLDCYNAGQPSVEMHPAKRTRPWMDATDRHVYRCLPLTIANSTGWQMINPVSFTAVWSGGSREEDMIIRPEGKGCIATSHFGYGVLTFHVFGLFRTDPGVQLWVSGPPNDVKDSIQPLTGIVETDWSHMSFTMNWKFTRPMETIRFEAGDPFCQIMPIRLDDIESMEPSYKSFTEEQELEDKYRDWSKNRDEFNAELVSSTEPRAPSDTWQRDYHRNSNRTKVKLKDWIYK